MFNPRVTRLDRSASRKKVESSYRDLIKRVLGETRLHVRKIILLRLLSHLFSRAVSIQPTLFSKQLDRGTIRFNPSAAKQVLQQCFASRIGDDFL